MDENALADLFVANETFSELERALDVFCPFEAVGMVRQEIRHGHFLSYIFDPQRPHGFGSDCLRGLMAAASKAKSQLAADLSLFDVHMMDFDGATVRREWRNIDTASVPRCPAESPLSARTRGDLVSPLGKGLAWPMGSANIGNIRLAHPAFRPCG